MSSFKKQPMLGTSEHAAAMLTNQVSKAALIDLYLQALAMTLGSCDTPPTIEEVIEHASPTLAIRGDRRLKPR